MGKNQKNKKRNNKKIQEKVQSQKAGVLEQSNYRLISPYWNAVTIILVDHVFNQYQWKHQVIEMIMNNKVPMDIVDTTMLMDENYDQEKYTRWVARMMMKSEIVLFNIHATDGVSSVDKLKENFESEMIKSKYVIVRLDPDMDHEMLTKAIEIINQYDNVIYMTSDKNLIQSLLALSKELL